MFSLSNKKRREVGRAKDLSAPWQRKAQVLGEKKNLSQCHFLSTNTTWISLGLKVGLSD